MPDLDNEEFYESDSSDNEENHSKLLNSVSQLDSTQRVKPAQRKEVASEVSEYNLNQGLSGNRNLVRVKELAQALGKKSGHGVITKKIEKVTKSARTLPKPLEKPVEERLKRSVGFENVKKQLGRWDAIVSRNALKDRIVYPINNSKIKIQKTSEFLSQFKTKTPLEEEIAKVLKEETQEEKETDDNEYPLTLEEMMEKRKEMAQLRAKLSYKQSKAQRQSKIKSKKYHRLLKREKLKQQIKEFELLQKTNPEAALKKLSELDKTRAQERASLRHRNTGQWAKNLSVRAKYDVETRKVLAEQLKMSRELTQKVSQLDSDDDDDEDAVQEDEHGGKVENLVSNQTKNDVCSSDNPWTLDVTKEVQEFVTGYKKFWTEKNKEINQRETENGENVETPKEEKVKEETPKTIQNGEVLKDGEKTKGSEHKTKKATKRKTDKPRVSDTPKKEASMSVHPASGVWIVTPVVESSVETEKKGKADDLDALFDDLNDELMRKATEKVATMEKNMKKQKRKRNHLKKTDDGDEGFDLSLNNTRTTVERPDLDTGLLEGGQEDVVRNSVNSGVSDSGNKVAPAPAIDPKIFIQVKPKRLKTHLPENITGEEEDAVDDGKAQEKIIEEAFGGDDVMAEFKEMKDEEEKSTNVEIETSLPGWGEWGGTGIAPNPRKKRRLILNVPPRKDKDKKDVIMNENENPNLKNHLVKEVPHPFKSVDAFEANIRAPVGRDWVPETAHQKLIQKQVVTKLGTVIEPMDEEAIVTLKKASKSPYRGKKKKENNNQLKN